MIIIALSIRSLITQVKITLTLRNIGGWIIYIHKKNHLLGDSEDLYGGYSKYHMTENNIISRKNIVVAEQMTMNHSFGHDDQLEAEPALTLSHKTMNAYTLQLEKFDQLNTEEAPCDESNRKEH